jgi:hypothetical protein
LRKRELFGLFLRWRERLEGCVHLCPEGCRSVDFGHELSDLLNGAQARALALLQLLDQVGVAGRFAAEGGRRHLVPSRGIDPAKQLGFGDDLHGCFINQRLLTLQALNVSNNCTSCG